MLLTSLLSSASSLAVPSGAQKHFESTGDQLGHAWPSPTSSTIVQQHPAAAAAEAPALLDQQQQQQNGHRRADTVPGSPSAGSAEEDRPDLFNLTLTAMRHYLRNHLNASRYGKAPRKRSHVQVDAVDVEFYRRFKEFNSSQVALDGATANFSTQIAHHNSTPSERTSALNGTHVGQDLAGVGVETAAGAARAVHPVAAFGPSSPTSSSSPLPSAPASGSSSAAGSQRDYSVLMDDPRGYITVSSSFPPRPGKTSTPWNSTTDQRKGKWYGQDQETTARRVR
uniref:Uncharacterized protein n=1 Tax=Anopheles atroparvus TaxID=41427 RepID=A0A182J3U3_ANOAO